MSSVTGIPPQQIPQKPALKFGTQSGSTTIPSVAPPIIGTTQTEVIKQLNDQIETLAKQNKIDLSAKKTTGQEKRYNQLLQVAAKKILHTSETNTKTLPYFDADGVLHSAFKINERQATIFNNAVSNIYNRHIEFPFKIKKTKEAEKLAAQSADMKRFFGKNTPSAATDIFEPYTRVTAGNDPNLTPTNDENSQNREPISTVTDAATNGDIPVPPADQPKPDEQNSTTTEADGVDKAKEKTLTTNQSTTSIDQPKPNEQSGTKKTTTDDVNEANEIKPPTNQSPTPADNDSNKTKPEEKQNNDNQGLLHGYVGTKVGIGAALLASGIALKLTLIGIVPGLILAGAGAAIMAWGAANYLLNDNDKKDDNPAAASSQCSPTIILASSTALTIVWEPFFKG